MWRFFRKSFWIPYEDKTVRPDGMIAHKAIVAYCEKQGMSYRFPDMDTVILDGKEYDILRRFDYGCRGYGILCREK